MMHCFKQRKDAIQYLETRMSKNKISNAQTSTNKKKEDTVILSKVDICANLRIK